VEGKKSGIDGPRKASLEPKREPPLLEKQVSAGWQNRGHWGWGGGGKKLLESTSFEIWQGKSSTIRNFLENGGMKNPSII